LGVRPSSRNSEPETADERRAAPPSLLLIADS